MGDIQTQGYTLLNPQGHGKRIIHIHADADEPGRVYQPAMTVTATAPAFVAALAALPASGQDKTVTVFAAA